MVEWWGKGWSNVASFSQAIPIQCHTHPILSFCFIQSMHWAMPQKPVLSLPEAAVGDTAEAAANTSDTPDTQGQHKNVMQDSNSKFTSPPVSLRDFRRGGLKLKA